MSNWMVQFAYSELMFLSSFVLFCPHFELTLIYICPLDIMKLLKMAELLWGAAAP